MSGDDGRPDPSVPVPPPPVGDDTTTTPADDGGCAFLGCSDFGGVVDECDTFAQDCPAGFKCTVWANDGGPAWNATRCVRVVPDPAAVGEPCTAEGSGASGIDDCALGGICWNVDERLQGTCADFCMGSPESPQCPEDFLCAISSGPLALCLGTCDPLGDDCPDGEACYPVNESFTCSPDASGEFGAYGDTCEFINACDSGLICIGADAFGDCVGGIGCCSPVCDVTAMDPDAPCTSPGQGCQAWYRVGQAPAGYEDVGVCALPQ
jgi:hypothetical protein